MQQGAEEADAYAAWKAEQEEIGHELARAQHAQESFWRQIRRRCVWLNVEGRRGRRAGSSPRGRRGSRRSGSSAPGRPGRPADDDPQPDLAACRGAVS